MCSLIFLLCCCIVALITRVRPKQLRLDSLINFDERTEFHVQLFWLHILTFFSKIHHLFIVSNSQFGILLSLVMIVPIFTIYIYKSKQQPRHHLSSSKTASVCCESKGDWDYGGYFIYGIYVIYKYRLTSSPMFSSWIRIKLSFVCLSFLYYK